MIKKKLMRKLYRKLSEKDFNEVKEYIFELQKNHFHRIDLKVIKTFCSSFKKESSKILYDYLYHILLKKQ